jgi:hypothetical protein
MKGAGSMTLFLAAFLVAALGPNGLGDSDGPSLPPLPTQQPTAAPVTSAREEKKESEPTAKLTLQEKRESIVPGKHGDGLAEKGKIEVKAEKPDEMTVSLSGVAAAHCFVGCHSAAIQTFQLSQEFDVAAANSSSNEVVLTLESALNGYLRSHHKGGASLRVADVAIAEAGTGRVLVSVAHSPLSVSGDCARTYKNESTAAPVTVRAGRYVLAARFVFEAQAGGLTNARGVSDFSSDALPDLWQQAKDPFKDVDRKEFGFSITLSVAAPEPTAKPKPDRPQAKSSEKRPSPSARSVSMPRQIP